MQEDNHIDNLFHSALEPFEATPSDKVWSSLDAQLSSKQAAIVEESSSDKKKRNRRLFFFLFALLVTSFVSYEYFVPSLNKVPVVATVASENTKAEPTKDQQLAKLSNSDVQKTVSEQQTPEQASEGKMTVSGSHDLVADNSGKAAINARVNSSITAGSTMLAKSNKNSTPQSKGNSPQVNNNSSNQLPSINKGIKKSGSDNSISPFLASAKLNKSENSNEADFINNKPSEATSKTTENNNTTPASANSPGNISPESTENSSNSPSALKENETASSNDLKPEPQETKTTEVSNAALPPTPEPQPVQIAATNSLHPIGNFVTKLSAAGFYAPEIANQYLKNGNSNSSQNSSTVSSEKFNFSYNAGALFRYDISAAGRWSIGLGCSYSTLEQLTSVTTTFIIPPDTGHSNPFHPESSGSSFFHFSNSSGNNEYTFNTSCGTVHLQNPPSIFRSHSNKADTVKFTTNTTILLKYINIPLTIRYYPDFLVKGRFSCYADGGVAFSFLTNKQAKVVIGDEYNETSSDIAGLRPMYYGCIFGLGAQYQFFKGLSVFAEPTFRGSVSSITDSNSPAFNPYSLGISTGLSYHF